MSKRFGKKRVNGCECTQIFTCGKCLEEAAWRDLRLRRDILEIKN